MKKVIFVGGTAYSGSTFFDMTLANDPKGFSCGEVNAIFYPYRRKHLLVEELSKEIDWVKIKKSGPANLYSNIFELFPEVEFIVDSSKSPLWISERTADLNKLGIDVRNILIWKYPLEFKKSRSKRGQEKGWTREWLNYHRYYMSVVKDWRAIKYSDYVKQKNMLERICDELEIDYFAGKENFWDKKQHTLFGNTSAKIHLTDVTSNEYGKFEKEIKTNIAASGGNSEEIVEKHKSIYYEESEMLQNNKSELDTRFQNILDVLEYADISNRNFTYEDFQRRLKPLHVSAPYKMYQTIKQKYSIVRILDH